MSDMMSNITKTPREELECKKKYLYEHSMFWECNNGSKCQILEEDVCDLLNELNNKFKRDIEELGISIKLFEDDIATRDKKIDEQQATINLLLDLLYQSEETVINEYSSHIGEDMDKLDKIFKEKDIKEIERFVRGCDDE